MANFRILTVSLSRDELAAVRTLAKREGLAVSGLVRRMLMPLIHERLASTSATERRPR